MTIEIPTLLSTLACVFLILAIAWLSIPFLLIGWGVIRTLYCVLFKNKGVRMHFGKSRPPEYPPDPGASITDTELGLTPEPWEHAELLAAWRQERFDV